MNILKKMSLFKSSEGLVYIANPELGAEGLVRILHWTGEENIYSGPMVVLGDEESVNSPSWRHLYKDWTRIASETKSQHVARPFRTNETEPWEAVEDALHLRSDHFLPRPAISSTRIVIGTRMSTR